MVPFVVFTGAAICLNHEFAQLAVTVFVPTADKLVYMLFCAFSRDKNVGED